MEKYYSKYYNYKLHSDSDKNRLLWICSQGDIGFIYYYLYFINDIEDIKKLQKNYQKEDENLKKLKKQLTLLIEKTNDNSECQNYNISKIYYLEEDLNKDNSVDNLFYDKNLDKTDISIRKTVITQNPNIEKNPEEFRKKIKLHFIDKNNYVVDIDQEVENIIDGGKTVKVGDKALLKNGPNYHIYQRVRPSNSDYDMWILDKKDQNLLSHIDYCEQQGLNLDEIQWDELTKCTYNRQQGECLNETNNSNYKQVQLLKKMIERSEKWISNLSTLSEINNYRHEIIKYFKDLIIYRKKYFTGDLKLNLSSKLDISDLNISESNLINQLSKLLKIL